MFTGSSYNPTCRQEVGPTLQLSQDLMSKVPPQLQENNGPLGFGIRLVNAKGATRHTLDSRHAAREPGQLSVNRHGFQVTCNILSTYRPYLQTAFQTTRGIWIQRVEARGGFPNVASKPRAGDPFQLIDISLVAKTHVFNLISAWSSQKKTKQSKKKQLILSKTGSLCPRHVRHVPLAFVKAQYTLPFQWSHQKLILFSLISAWSLQKPTNNTFFGERRSKHNQHNQNNQNYQHNQHNQTQPTQQKTPNNFSLGSLRPFRLAVGRGATAPPWRTRWPQSLERPPARRRGWTAAGGREANSRLRTEKSPEPLGSLPKFWDVTPFGSHGDLGTRLSFWSWGPFFVCVCARFFWGEGVGRGIWAASLTRRYGEFSHTDSKLQNVVLSRETTRDTKTMLG